MDVSQFIKDLNQFEADRIGRDSTWDILFVDKRNHPCYLRVTHYRSIYYLTAFDKDLDLLEIREDQLIEEGNEWGKIIQDAHEWLKFAKKNWIKANKYMQENYPLDCRYGTIAHSLVREKIPGIYRLDEVLGDEKIKKFTHLIDKISLRKTVPSMTANDYLEYCKIAYVALDQKDKDTAAIDLYKRYADGRHDGLLDMDLYSAEEFKKWLLEKAGGGHPFEIKRGGNSTHIDLYVHFKDFCFENGFSLTVEGRSLSRMAEVVSMTIALFEADAPINIENPENILKRILAQDRIGIVPAYYKSLHRLNQRFKEDDVFEVMYLSDLGRQKRNLLPFICFEPLPLLRPKTNLST